MKNHVQHMAILLLVAAMFTACAAVSPSVQGKPDGAYYDNEIEAPLYNATIEYGDPDLITDNTGPLWAYIRYPQAGESTDYIIARWAEEMYDSAVAEINELRVADPAVEGEINIQFDSYLVDGRYVGILENGSFTNTIAAHPRDIVRTFNIDMEKELFLDNSEILNPLQNEKILSMLYDKIALMYPDASDLIYEAEENWLEHIVVGSDGLIVVMERYKALPGSFGPLSVMLPYDEIAFALRLGDEIPQAGSPGDQTVQAETPPVQINGDIDPSRPMVALTFDDGPSKDTQRIIKLLEDYNSRATFFVIGNLAESRGENIARAIEAGCEVAGHSWDHRDLTKLSNEDIKAQILSAHSAVEAIAGPSPMFYRPPYGAMNDKVKAVSAELGFSIIIWSVDPRDWQTRNADAVHSAIMNNVKDRSIVLSHDLYKTTADAMERVIPELISKGYQLVTISELFYYNDITPEAGKAYSRGN